MFTNSDLASALTLILLKSFSAKSVLSFTLLQNQYVTTQHSCWCQLSAAHAHGAGPGVLLEEAIRSIAETSCAAISKADVKRNSPTPQSIGNYL